MTTSTTTIELPRIEGESSRAYSARVEYVTMGPGRSIDKLADQNGIKTGSRVSRYLEWSRKYGWVDSAAKYDSEVVLMTVNEAADQYRADLEAHREKSMTSAKNLMALANGLTRIYADALQQPQKITDKDGKTYTLHKIAVDANTLTTISKATTASLDLEAHALNIDKLLPSLINDSE